MAQIEDLVTVFIEVSDVRRKEGFEVGLGGGIVFHAVECFFSLNGCTGLKAYIEYAEFESQ